MLDLRVSWSLPSLAKIYLTYSIVLDYDIEEDIFYIFTDWASRSVFNERLKRKTGRFWWKGIWFIYFDDKLELQEEDKSNYTAYIQSTNLDMELWASIDWLKELLCSTINLDRYRKVMIITDCEFLRKNWTNAYYWNRDKSKRETVDWDPIVHKKKRKKLCKLIHETYSIYFKKVEFDWVKAHSWNEHNTKADKSAVKWAQSKTRVFWTNIERRSPFFADSNRHKAYLPVSWMVLLIHIIGTRYLRNKKIRYNYEVVSRDNDMYKMTWRIHYDKKALSAEFIYKVRMKNDGSHQIDEILEEHTKIDIKNEMIKDGIDTNCLYWKLWE